MSLLTYYRVIVKDEAQVVRVALRGRLQRRRFGGRFAEMLRREKMALGVWMETPGRCWARRGEYDGGNAGEDGERMRWDERMASLGVLEMLRRWRGW
jgi:hypothetical protein